MALSQTEMIGTERWCMVGDPPHCYHEPLWHFHKFGVEIHDYVLGPEGFNRLRWFAVTRHPVETIWSSFGTAHALSGRACTSRFLPFLCLLQESRNIKTVYFSVYFPLRSAVHGRLFTEPSLPCWNIIVRLGITGLSLRRRHEQTNVAWPLGRLCSLIALEDPPGHLGPNLTCSTQTTATDNIDRET